MSKEKCSSSRADPASRKRKAEERDEASFQAYLEDDRVDSLSSLKSQRDRVDPDLIWKDVEGADVTIYSLDGDTSPPRIGFSMRIVADLTVFIWIAGMLVNPKDYAWITPGNRLTRWSQLDNLLSHYKNASLPCHDDTKSKVNYASELLQSCTGADQTGLLSFIAEQLKLWLCAPTARRYSIQTMMAAFTWSFFSKPGYENLRLLLILPHARVL